MCYYKDQRRVQQCERSRALVLVPIFVKCITWHQYNERPRVLASLNSPRCSIQCSPLILLIQKFSLGFYFQETYAKFRENKNGEITLFFFFFQILLNLFFFCPLQFSPQRSGPSLGFICNCEVHKVNKYLSYIINSLTSLAMRSLYDFMIQLQIDLRRNVSSKKF